MEIRQATATKRGMAVKNITKILALVICMYGAAIPAFATEANDKRLEILQSEKADVQAELATEMSSYLNEKDKSKADKRIDVLKINLRDLDTEITHTKRSTTPEVFFSSDSSNSKSRVVTSQKGSKEGRGATEVVTHREPWDVFRNF